MKIPIYVVKLGGNLYVDSEFYGLYPSTTNNIVNANFFEDYRKAAKVAKKAHGRVLELFLTDEHVEGEIPEENSKEVKEDAFDKAFNRLSSLFHRK